MENTIVSVEWLKENLDNPKLVVLVAGQDLDSNSPQIEGARTFDLKKKFSQQQSDFPNTFPSAEQFEKGCREIGINEDSEIVVYDDKGVFWSPRVWWMFKTMGHQSVAVLDGGLPEWIAQGNDTYSGSDSSFMLGNFKAQFVPSQVKDFSFIQSNVDSKEALLIDARSAERFSGTAPEPREGLRSGHIPGSVNLPYTDVIPDGKFKSIAELNEVFRDYRAEEKPFVFTCGSGITACIILLACEMVMSHENSVYDGSWTEWAQLSS
jgi:thiosulfate/3-mercaptopyruvate sulfurtransferase